MDRSDLPDRGNHEIRRAAASRLTRLLENARQEKGVSDETLKSELRLSTDALGAIRRGDFDALGPSVYARGFVFAYAREVDAPLGEVHALWRDMEAHEGESPLVTTQPPNSGLPGAVLRAATAVVVLVVLVGPALWLHGQGKPADWFMNEPPPPVQARVDGADIPGPITPAAPLLDLPVGFGDPFETTVAAGIGRLPAIAAVPRQEKPAAAPLVLELYFNGDCWVEVHDGEGRRVEYDLIRANSHRRFEGEDQFSVFLGRADAVTVAVNGEYFDTTPFQIRNLARFVVNEPGPASAE